MSSTPRRSAWIIGCGDVGCRLALRLRADGVNPTGFVRSQASATALQQLGIASQRLDLDTADLQLPPMSMPDWLYYCAPPAAPGREDTRLRRLLHALPAAPARLIYFSTSGVYGDCDGRWIDEHEPLKPAHDRARRRVDAERAVADYAADHQITAVILRIPGIYGPGRLKADRLRDGRPLAQPDQSPWSNRVHAEDLAEVALRAATRSAANGIYNVSDGRPSTMTDYLQRCAALLELPPPPLQSLAQVLAAATPMAREFLSESKRLLNQRACIELDWQPRVLDGDSGLAACLQTDAVVTARRADD